IKETETFVEKWSKKYPSMNRMFDKEISEKLFAFLEFPWQIRRMLYTTNWIENLNDSIKRTTKIRRSFPTEDSALNLVSYACMEREEKRYKYPVTSFYPVKNVLDEMLLSLKQKQERS
ncbi:Transposase, mutator type, partial [Candidatus Omnitrophus magneticus]